MENNYFKSISVSLLMLIIAFIGLSYINISRADTFNLIYRDTGCPNQYLPGGANVDCTYYTGSLGIGGCPPGDYSGTSYCYPTSNWSSGNNTLSISQNVNFGTDKKSYKIGEQIHPFFTSSELTVTCPARYVLTMPANMTPSNLNAYINLGLGIKQSKFTSSNWVNSFTLNKGGDYTLGGELKRNPLTYINDCNQAGNIDIQKLYDYGIYPITATFTVPFITSLFLR